MAQDRRAQYSMEAENPAAAVQRGQVWLSVLRAGPRALQRPRSEDQTS
jgi:hypothetical protein